LDAINSEGSVDRSAEGFIVDHIFRVVSLVFLSQGKEFFLG
jgi:hypothetical protein